eukprot:TRINITY_DN31046_c0_g1_i2.p1 TRINITY_DN31046_c0_g1~~TRINITY_DN31046_c0_g1_i2.p1  ORF type:complete len:328 (+),score=38.21 TRINITY_DN31046_c0_g1_i2:63-986(+)
MCIRDSSKISMMVKNLKKERDYHEAHIQRIYEKLQVFLGRLNIEVSTDNLSVPRRINKQLETLNALMMDKLMENEELQKTLLEMSEQVKQMNVATISADNEQKLLKEALTQTKAKYTKYSTKYREVEKENKEMKSKLDTFISESNYLGQMIQDLEIQKEKLLKELAAEKEKGQIPSTTKETEQLSSALTSESEDANLKFLKEIENLKKKNNELVAKVDDLAEKFNLKVINVTLLGMEIDRLHIVIREIAEEFEPTEGQLSDESNLLPVLKKQHTTQDKTLIYGNTLNLRQIFATKSESIKSNYQDVL